MVTIFVDETAVVPTHSARNIGVVFDHTMSMVPHIASVCKTSHYHLRNIGGIRKYITEEACIKLMHAFVTSRVDYCNSLFYGIPGIHTKRLQKILNTAARIVSLRPKYDHIMKFKILLFTFRAIQGSGPSYLSSIIMSHQPSLNMRSSDKMMLVPHSNKTSNSYGDRAFANCGPVLWNTLPLHIRRIKDLGDFKSKLKTHLFQEAYQ